MERRGRGRLFLSSAAQRYVTVSHRSSGIGDGLGVARLEPSFKDLPQKPIYLSNESPGCAKGACGVGVGYKDQRGGWGVGGRHACLQQEHLAVSTGTIKNSQKLLDASEAAGIPRLEKPTKGIGQLIRLCLLFTPLPAT